jgi:hypothetical protein
MDDWMHRLLEDHSEGQAFKPLGRVIDSQLVEASARKKKTVVRLRLRSPRCGSAPRRHPTKFRRKRCYLNRSPYTYSSMLAMSIMPIQEATFVIINKRRVRGRGKSEGKLVLCSCKAL